MAVAKRRGKTMIKIFFMPGCLKLIENFSLKPDLIRYGICRITCKTPHMRTPIATPTRGFSKKDENNTIPVIIPTFNKTGAKAGAKK